MTQPMLFAEPTKRTRTVNQDRDAILARLIRRDRTRFIEQAEAFVLTYLDTHPDGASGEVITAACKAAGIAPHDDRAFGPVYMRLAKRGAIQKVGTARRARGHNTSGGNVWARGR
jgi:hypothetical protein